MCDGFNYIQSEVEKTQKAIIGINDDLEQIFQQLNSHSQPNNMTLVKVEELINLQNQKAHALDI